MSISRRTAIAADAYDKLTLELGRVQTGLAMLDDEITDLDGLLSRKSRDPEIGRLINRVYFLRNSMTAFADAVLAAADEMRETAPGKPAAGPQP